MNTVHTLREYVDALHEAGILVESTVSDELAAREIHCLTYDTRALSEDALFICKGAHFKEEYLCDALSRGAIAYVAEKKHNVDAPCLLVNDIRYSLVVLGQLFYNHVTDKLTSVGITGTKGKSTKFLRNDWSNDIKFSITILLMISDKRGNQVTYTILAILVYISTIRYVFLCIRVTLNAFKALWIHYHIDDMNLIRTDPIINKVLL